MNFFNIQIRFSRSIIGGDQVIVDIDQIPYPTIFFFSKTNEVVLNIQAAEILGVDEKEKFDLDKWIEMNPLLEEEIKKYASIDCLNDKKVHMVNLNGKHEIINYSLRRIQNSSNGHLTIIHFKKASEKYTAASISSLYTTMEEIIKLKPYLNKTGKKLLDDLINKYYKNDDSQILTLDDLVYYEKELRIIQKAYPLLSHREVILCGLLVNDMDSQDIATITNRSIDAVFVTIHRINKKLNIENKKQLVSKLRELINNEEDKDSITS